METVDPPRRAVPEEDGALVEGGVHRLIHRGQEGIRHIPLHPGAPLREREVELQPLPDAVGPVAQDDDPLALGVPGLVLLPERRPEARVEDGAVDDPGKGSDQPAVVVYGSILFIFFSLLSDVLYAIVDPRVRLQ